MRLAAVQFFATPFAPERNLGTAERLARGAAAAGARAVVLPELFNTGYVYTPRLFEAAEDRDGPTTQWLLRLSDELQILIGGAMLIRAPTSDDSKTSEVFDTFVLAEPGGKSHHYRKQHPFVWEHCFWAAGAGPGLVETGLGRLGLLIGWDAAHRSAWAALRGQADLVLVSSAPPRWHRAVLNFPEAKKVYAADLVPEVLDHRAELDAWFLGGLGQGAALVQAPAVSSVMAGRFVTALPLARLSFKLAAARRPKYAGWAGEASQATLRATFYGDSAVFGPDGTVLAQAAGEEGWALADVKGAVTVASKQAAVDPADYLFPAVPTGLGRLDSLINFYGEGYRRNKQNQS